MRMTNSCVVKWLLAGVLCCAIFLNASLLARPSKPILPSKPDEILHQRPLPLEEPAPPQNPPIEAPPATDPPIVKPVEVVRPPAAEPEFLGMSAPVTQRPQHAENYGETTSAHQRECDAEVGWGVLDRIRRSEVRVCEGSVSRVACHPHKWKHSNYGTGSFCDMRSVALVGAKMQPGLKSGWAGEEGHLTFHSGSLVLAGCPGGARTFSSASVPLLGPLAELMQKGATDADELPQCDAWIEEPVVAIARNEWAHMLFSTCEATNALVAARAIFGPDASRVRILILDTSPLGPFGDYFAALSRGGSVIRAADLIGSGANGARTLCFRRLVTSVFGYASFLVSQATMSAATCHHSPILKEFRNEVLSHLKLLDGPYPDVPSALFISRRPYHHEGFNKKKIGRVIRNEEDVTTAMADDVTSGRLRFQFVDLATLSLKEQIEKVHSSNILIGMHGAGLVHAIFLPDDAAVLEIFPSGYGENMRDRNIARYMGHVYTSYELSSADNDLVNIDIDQFRKVLDSMVHIARGSFGHSAMRCGIKCKKTK